MPSRMPITARHLCSKLLHKTRLLISSTNQSWQFLRAVKAGPALVDYALGQLGLWRIVATTDHDNLASQQVMLKLGMAIHRNTAGEPPYFQVVGVQQA